MKKKEQIKHLRDKIEEQKGALYQSVFVNNELKKQLALRNETIAAKNEEISLLKSNLRTELDDVMKDTVTQATEVVALHEALCKNEAINANLKKEIAERDYHIELLEAEKKDLNAHIERYEALNGVMPRLLIPAEPANYREELKKLKEENESLKAKLKNQETLEAIANTKPFDVNILETELRNITKKYSILEEAFIKIRNITQAITHNHN